MLSKCAGLIARHAKGKTTVINASKNFSTRPAVSSFFDVGSATTAMPIPEGKGIIGEPTDASVDLMNVRPGDVIEVPYEVTVSHSFKDMWLSGFYSHERINTSTPFARKLGLQDQVAPFGMMLFLAGAMSHADSAKVQVGFKNAKYHWPAFAGDTFKKRFTIKSLRSTSSKDSSLFRIECELINQRDVTVFSCEKQMLFPFAVPPSEVEIETPHDKPDEKGGQDEFLQHLISQTQTLQELGSQTLRSVRPGQLILHTMMRPISQSYSMQMSTLARLTHDRHFNTHMYPKGSLFVPGGLVLGLTCSMASRDLHEVLFEDLEKCAYPNNLSPQEPVSAMSYVKSLQEHISGDIECITVRTIGLKNIDCGRDLEGRELPKDIFIGDIPRPAELEKILKNKFPELCGNIICIADRKIYRQAPKQTPFLL